MLFSRICFPHLPQAPPKQTPKTLEDKREADETIVKLADEEVMRDIEEDEFASYYKQGVVPKIMITTSECPSTVRHSSLSRCAHAVQHMKKFVTDLEELVPNSTYFKRKRILIRNFIQHGKDNEFTDLIIVTEKSKRPGQLPSCISVEK